MTRAFRVVFDIIVDMDAVPEENKKDVNPKVLAAGMIDVFKQNSSKDMQMDIVSVEEIK